MTDSPALTPEALDTIEGTKRAIMALLRQDDISGLDAIDLLGDASVAIEEQQVEIRRLRTENEEQGTRIAAALTYHRKLERPKIEDCSCGSIVPCRVRAVLEAPRAALTGEATEQKEALEPTTCVSCRHNIFHIDEGWIHSYPGLDEKHAALPSHAPLTGGAGE
jgi:hypothetical protein